MSNTFNIQSLQKSFLLPLVFCILTTLLLAKYRHFLQQYEERLLEQQKNILSEKTPVTELYANVISKYGNLIKNSTRWVYTSLESVRQQQFQDNLMKSDQTDNISIYPNWHACEKVIPTM